MDNVLYQKANPLEEERLSKESRKNQLLLNTSWKAVSPYLNKKSTFCDMGAGSNGNLGRMVSETGAQYHAFDKNPEMLKKLKESLKGARGIHISIADASTFFKKDNYFDVSHVRLVLMHNGPENRKKIIKNMVQCAVTSFFIEWNWSVIKGEGLLFKKSLSALLSFSELFNINTDQGKVLENEIRHVVAGRISSTCIKSPVEDNTEEMIDLLKTAKASLEAKPTPNVLLLEKITECLEEFNLGKRVEYRRADLVVVKVTKK